jgi:hypothetical protein
MAVQVNHFHCDFGYKDCVYIPETDYIPVECLSCSKGDRYVKKDTSASDGSTASYYTLPSGAKELQDLISNRDMNAQIGEIFRACYRMGRASHSDVMRDVRKIIFYAQAELLRLETIKKKGPK